MTTTDINNIADAVMQQIHIPKLWLTPDDLETEFSIGKVRQGALRSKRMIPFSKRGRYIRYNRDDINQWFLDAKVV